MSETTKDAATRARWTLIVVCIATFMLLVDITIVNVGLPSIQREFNSSFTGLQWVLDAYALSLASFLLAAGALADRVGRRLVFSAGICIFTLASLACGLAQGTTMLDLARALQGVGGAAMFATSLALLAQEFAGPARVRALAVWASTVGAAVAIGPLLGGALTQALSWRWIFIVNVPVGVTAVALALARLAEHRDGRARGHDAAGLATFSTALFLLVHALLRGNTLGWSSAVIVGSLCGGVALLALFVAVERRAAAPLLELALFTRPAFVGVSLATFAIGAGMFAMFVYFSIYLQGVLGYGPLAAGVRLLPITVMVLCVPLATRRFALRVAPRVLLSAGLVLVSSGLLLMRAVAVGSGWTAMVVGFLVAGVGIGLANPAIAVAAVGVVEREQSGMASGINNTFRLGGLATGVAALGALFQHQIAVALGPNAQFAATVAAGGPAALRSAPPALARSATGAFVAGFDEILLVGALVTAAGAATAWLLMRTPVVAAPELAPTPITNTTGAN